MPSKLAIDGGKPASLALIPYGRQSIDADDIAAVTAVLQGDWITQGPAIAQFEKDVCAYTGAKHAVALSNGTAALHLSVLAAGIKAGDEVIVTPYTFAASANAVLYAGAKPVFADIDSPTLNLDPDAVRKKITQKTKAIVAVHFAGLPADLDALREIAEEKDLALIEDAAHALGASYGNEKIGGKAQLATLSFHPVKSITTGEGGMVLTSDDALAQSLRLLRTHGITREPKAPYPGNPAWYNAQEQLGFNYRLTDFQAALGSSQLKKLDGFVKRRNEIARAYHDAFFGLDALQLPADAPSGSRHAWHLYALRFKTGALKAGRDQIFAALRAENLGVNVHYLPVYWHPFYRDLGFKAGLCPAAERAFQEEITLPLFPAMSQTQIDAVIAAVQKVLATYARR